MSRVVHTLPERALPGRLVPGALSLPPERRPSPRRQGQRSHQDDCGPSFHQERQDRQQAPYCRAGRAWRLRPHLPCRRCQRGDGRQDRGRQRRSREPPSHRRKPPLSRQSARRSSLARRSSTRLANTPVGRMATQSTPTPPRAISASSRRACAASTSTAQRSTFTGIWRSSISASTTVSASAFTMGNVRRWQSGMRLATASRTGGLTKRDYTHGAKRFLRWRRKNRRPQKRKVKRIWVR